MVCIFKRVIGLFVVAVFLCSLAQVAIAEDAISINVQAEKVASETVPEEVTVSKVAPSVIETAAWDPADIKEEDPSSATTDGSAGDEDIDGSIDISEETGDSTEDLPSPEQAPQRSVWVALYGEPGSFQYGDTVTMEAMLVGFEGVSPFITWEYSLNGKDGWMTAPGNCSGVRYQLNLNQENALWFWRVVVVV